MSFYLGLMNKTIKQQFAYRANVLFEIIGNILRVVIQVSIWRALLGSGGIVGQVSLSDMITYTVISIIVWGLVKSDIAYTLADKVKSGSITMDLIKPVSL